MITDAQLAELKALDQAASQGPWSVALNNPDHHPSYDDAWFIPEIWDHGHGSAEDAGISSKEDAELIAMARNLLPDLLAEIERLRVENRRLMRDDATTRKLTTRKLTDWGGSDPHLTGGLGTDEFLRRGRAERGEP